MSLHGRTGSRSRNAPLDGIVVGSADVSAVTGVHGSQDGTRKLSNEYTNGVVFVDPTSRMLRMPAPVPVARAASVASTCQSAGSAPLASHSLARRLVPNHSNLTV